MNVSELLASVEHPYVAMFAPALIENAELLADIAAKIDAADDDDAPTWAATMAAATKDENLRAVAANYDQKAAELKALRASIYFAVNGHDEKDSDRTILIDTAKKSYYAARQMVVLVEETCGVPGFVNGYLSALTIPEGSGLRKSMKKYAVLDKKV